MAYGPIVFWHDVFIPRPFGIGYMRGNFEIPLISALICLFYFEVSIVS